MGSESNNDAEAAKAAEAAKREAERLEREAENQRIADLRREWGNG